MKKILLLYATMEGQTAKIAAAMKETMENAGTEVTLLNVQDPGRTAVPDLQAYDRLVFGASIHVGKIEKEMTVFINTHAQAIRAKPASLFVVLLSAATRDAERRETSLAAVRRTLEKTLDVHFEDVEMIAGALLYSKYNWFTRWVMKRIAAKEGGSTDTSRDHEYTDWAQVENYAKRLAAG